MRAGEVVSESDGVAAMNTAIVTLTIRYDADEYGDPALWHWQGKLDEQAEVLNVVAVPACPQDGSPMVPDVERDEKPDGGALGYPIWRCPSCGYAEERDG